MLKNILVEYPNDPICLVHGTPTTSSKYLFCIGFHLKLGLAVCRPSGVKVSSAATGVRNRDELLQSLVRRQQKGSQTHIRDRMFAFDAFLLDIKIGNPSF